MDTAATPAKSSTRKKGRDKPHRFTVDQVATALRVARGNLSGAARALQCDRQTVYGYIADHPELEAVRAEGTELRLDLAENALDRAVAQGEAWAVCFLLKTIGRRRGYVERQEVEHSGAITVQLTATEAKI